MSLTQISSYGSWPYVEFVYPRIISNHLALRCRKVLALKRLVYSKCQDVHCADPRNGSKKMTKVSIGQRPVWAPWCRQQNVIDLRSENTVVSWARQPPSSVLEWIRWKRKDRHGNHLLSITWPRLDFWKSPCKQRFFVLTLSSPFHFFLFPFYRFFSPPENDSFRKDFCFTHDVFFVNRQISEMRGPTGVKFCTRVSTGPSFIMPVQNFGQNFWGHTPKKFQGPKTCKIWPDFGRLRSSAANISETDEDIQNRIVTPCMAIPPALGETSLVKFVPVTLEI